MSKNLFEELIDGAKSIVQSAAEAGKRIGQSEGYQNAKAEAKQKWEAFNSSDSVKNFKSDAKKTWDDVRASQTVQDIKQRMADLGSKVTNLTGECPYCHAQIPGDAVYCPYCGKAVTVEEPPKEMPALEETQEETPEETQEDT